jgi:hypothetical protein
LLIREEDHYVRMLRSYFRHTLPSYDSRLLYLRTVRRAN